MYEPNNWSFLTQLKDGSYKGNITNNKRNGYGKMTYNSGQVYEGEWKEDEFIKGMIEELNGKITKMK